MEKLKELLKEDSRFVDSERKFLKNKIIEYALKLDEDLIKLLLKNERIKNHFFKDVDGVLVFDREKFMKFIDNKEFLPDSYTAFKNKIGLANEDGKYLAKSKEVVLVWPYKDCVLEGGQEKPDEKRKEIFHNVILAPDEIDRLLEPKVFTNFKRIDKDGEHPLDGFRRDAEINRKRGLPEDTITDNLIIKGNNLLVLHSLLKEFRGKVKLIYIDPPYNTGNDEFQYNDNFKHSTWLTFMKNRLEVARKLLSEDGSIYINIDFNEVHYLKVLMDEIFGKDNFQREIIWRIGWLSGFKTTTKNYIRNHDTILFYTKSKNFKFNKEKAFTTRKDFIERFNDVAKREISEYLKKLGVKENNKINEFIEFISYVGLPEKYPLEDTWNCSIYDKLNSIAIVSYSGEKVSKLLNTEEFKGQKPEELLKRIIEISTDPGDIVLDFFMGSGTTCAVAHKIGRQYIGVEQIEYINYFVVPRLKKVLNGETIGISKEINWKGGGDFVYMELMKLNEAFVEKIEDAKTTENLINIWEDMKHNGFLSYRVDPRLFDENIEEFKMLSLDEQKKLLLDMLEYNDLYVNYSEIEDAVYEVSEEDKKLNKEFYEGRQDA